MDYTLNIREVTYSLSEALDFVGIDDTMHGKRVAYMAAELAKQMSWDLKLVNDLIFIGMLHDCGVSSTDVHVHLVTELDWDNSQIHSIRGEYLLQRTKIYAQYATYVRYHHTHWENLPKSLTKEEKEIANLIYLVDRVDAIRAQHPKDNLQTLNIIKETIQKYSSTMFSPELVKAFIAISSRDSFWFYLESESLSEYLTDWVEQGSNENFSFEDVKEIAFMFSAIVDAKSIFTSEHSYGVATLSKYFAQQFQLSQEMCEKIELAGLLHDLGKLRVDDAILNKPTELNEEERLKMNRHGFDSDMILRRIRGFKEIAHIASLHHETLDAKGYPYNLDAKQIPFEARILAVADIFQALIQNRPYRNGLSMHEAYEIMYSMCEEGKLDTRVIEMLREHLGECYKYAMVEYSVQDTFVQ